MVVLGQHVFVIGKFKGLAPISHSGRGKTFFGKATLSWEELAEQRKTSLA